MRKVNDILNKMIFGLGDAEFHTNLSIRKLLVRFDHYSKNRAEERRFQAAIVGAKLEKS